jgi:hypothetical protein
VDTGTQFKGRFCWPAQDRDRAHSPLQAPRIPSVFTASVLFSSKSSVAGTHHFTRSVSLLGSSRTHISQSWRKRFEVDEGCCGCCKIGLPGQAPLFHENWPHPALHLLIPEVTKVRNSDSWMGGAALGCSSTTPSMQRHGSAWAQTAKLLGSPDWRVMGDQDLPEQL